MYPTLVARGRVFLAGGQDATTGEQLADVWMFELDRGYWTKVPRVDGTLVEILATSYSYRDGTLWLVDRDARDPARVTVRLLRVDPVTGSWEVAYAADPQTTPEYDTKLIAGRISAAHRQDAFAQEARALPRTIAVRTGPSTSATTKYDFAPELLFTTSRALP